MAKKIGIPQNQGRGIGFATHQTDLCIVICNQQVGGSNPSAGSIKSMTYVPKNPSPNQKNMGKACVLESWSAFHHAIVYRPVFRNSITKASIIALSWVFKICREFKKRPQPGPGRKGSIRIIVFFIGCNLPKLRKGLAKTKKSKLRARPAGANSW